MRTRVRTHEACRTWHTYVRTYVRTDVRRRAHFSAARIARAAPTSAAKPRNIPNNVRTYVPKAWGIVVHARKKTNTHTHTHAQARFCGRAKRILRCRLADRLEDIGCAHGRAGAQKFANCQTLRTYVLTYQGQAWERSAPPPAGSSGLTRPQCPPCPERGILLRDLKTTPEELQGGPKRPPK